MIIQSSKVFISGSFIKAQVHIESGQIRTVQAYNADKPDIDYGDSMIVPGFIDVHTHGGYGYAVDGGTKDGLVKWLAKLPSEGVTAVLPATVTNVNEATIAAVSGVADVMRSPENIRGAQVLGIHLEGPFLDKDYRGAHDKNLIKTPSIALFEQFQEAASSNIKYITIAPEHDEGFEFIQYASQSGVKVAIGHSSACTETARLALANGASSFTHSFNAMRGLHHREPGVVGALMTSDGFAEVIADGHHLHPDVINILFKAKNYSKMILVTDSLICKGFETGIYELGGVKLEVDAFGAAKIHKTDTLAGSTLKMNDGIKFLVEQAMIPLNHAIMAATLYPAQMLGIERQKGQIVSFADADITVLDDGFNVVQTYCLGKEML